MTKSNRWQAFFFHCKSMRPCGCHSNKSFHLISLKKLVIIPLPEAYYIWEMIGTACRLRRYNWSKVLTDGQRTDGLPSYKPPWVFGPGELKGSYLEERRFLTETYWYCFILHNKICCGYSLQCLAEALLSSIHNIYFCEKIRKVIYGYLLLPGAMKMMRQGGRYEWRAYTGKIKYRHS